MAEKPNINLPQRGPDKQTGQFELSREAAGTTLSRIEKYEDLWAPTEKEGDERFKELSRQLWKEFSTHGFVIRDTEGKAKIIEQTDLDAKTSIYLHKLAGMDIRDLVYVTPGDIAEGRINTDTSNRHGVITEKTSDKLESYGRTSVDDHHTPESGSDLSATKLVYEKLVSLGLLEREDYLEKAVEFVNLLDNKKFPDQAKYFKQSFVTILGLERYLQPKHLFEFFKTDKRPTDILTRDELKKYGLTRAATKQLEVVNNSLAKMEEMKKEGFVVDSDRYGKIYVDIGKNLPGGYDAVNYAGGGVYVIWSPETGSFFTSTVGRPLEDSFNDGFKVRDTMWMKPKSSDSPLSITLAEVLNTLTDGKLKPEGALKDYLSQETAGVNIRDNAKTMHEEILQPNPFSSYLEELDRKFADDEITKDEWKTKKELIKTATDSSDPKGVLEEAFADDKITKKEYEELLNLTPSKEPAATEPSGESTQSAPAEIETEVETETETIDPKVRVSQIDQQVAEISKDLSEKVLRWSEAQKLKKERGELWAEKGNLLGHPLEEWEKWSEEQVDRFIKAQEDPANRAAISGDLSKEPEPKSKPIGIEKAYWEDIRRKMSQRTAGQEQRPQVPLAEKGQDGLEETRQEIREAGYALDQKSLYLQEVEKMIAHAKATGRVPDIGPEGLAYWENEKKKTKREIKKLEKELDDLWKKIPEGDRLESASPEPQPEPRIEPTPAPDVLADEEIRPDEEPPLPISDPEKITTQEKKGIGKTFKESVKKFFDREKKVKQPSEVGPKTTKATLLSWFKERGKSLLEVPVRGEVRQAEMLRFGTKYSANLAETYGTLIQKEMPELDPDAAQEIAKEVMDQNGKPASEISIEEFNQAVETAVKKRVEANDDQVNRNIGYVIDVIRERLVKSRGQATAEKVLTPEAIKKIEDELRLKMNELRKGQIVLDTKNLAKFMRENLDKYWWLRYGYAISEALLARKLISFMVGKIAGIAGAKETLVLPDLTDSPDLIPEDIGPISPEGMEKIYMDPGDNPWTISKQITNSVGLENPTPEQLKAIDTSFVKQNGISVSKWNISGATPDIKLPPGWYFTSDAFKTAGEFLIK